MTSDERRVTSDERRTGGVRNISRRPFADKKQLEALKKEVGETLTAARKKQNETIDELNGVKNMLSSTMQAKSQLEANMQTMKQDMKKVKDVAMDQVQNTKSAFSQQKIGKFHFWPHKTSCLYINYEK